MLLFADQPEAGPFIEAPCCSQIVIGPQREAAVACLACEGYCLIDQAPAQAAAPHVGFDIKQPELGGVDVFLYDKYRAHDPAARLGDPAEVAPGLELFDKPRRDFRNQRFEFFIPAMFLAMNRGLTMKDPAEIADAG